MRMLEVVFHTIGGIRQTRLLLGSDDHILYRVGTHNISLPAGHELPKYQEAHRLYDRFPLILGEVLPTTDLIVDVGANVGDTAAAFCNTAGRRIVCVEGSRRFFGLLEENARMLRRHGHEITCVNAIIGLPGISGEIREGTSSGELVLTKDGRQTQSLDDVISPLLQSDSRIILIKTDTDGMDGSILRSGERTLRQHEPLLFWENEIKTPNDVSAYSVAFEMLDDIGYNRFSIFDNFGNLIFETSAIDHLRSLIRYVLRMHQHQSTTTFPYFDVFASTNRFAELHEISISRFMRHYLAGQA
jgi:FkbM family methyltransferase